MSFSFDIKQELSEKENGARHCDIAELAAIINGCGEFVFIGENVGIKVQSENYHACEQCGRLIKKLFNFSAEVCVLAHHTQRRHYILYVGDFESAKKILSATGVCSNTRDGPLKTVSPLVVSGSCCKRAYIRGAFLTTGTISNPEKTYHAEFINSQKPVSVALLNIINSFSLNAKLLQRKENYAVYLKDSEQITDLLNIMQAHRALLELANVRVFKDVRNDVNRKVNFETANMNKTISAAVKQLEDINYINETEGLSFLSEQLRDAAELRLKYPDASLKEIGAMLEEPVSKSGINHRFRKISEIAEYIRRDDYAWQ